MATKKDINSLYKIGKIFNKNNINFNLQVERIKGKYRKYSKSEKDKINYFGRNYGLDKISKFQGKVCLAGINYFVLKPNGDIYRCHSAINNKNIKNSYLGNLIKGSFKLLNYPLKCPYEFCNCVNAYNKNLILNIKNDLNKPT